MKREIQLAVMALSRLPAGQIAGAVPELRQAVWAFPLVGALIGGLGALALSLVPNALGAGLALAVMVVASGALHEDGLADFADGLGGRTRARKLEIMRDSRIGSYGVVALILVLGLRWQALILVQPEALVAVAMLSRGLVPLAIHALPAARSDGLGAAASGAVPRGRLVIALALGAGAMLIFGSIPALFAGCMAALLVSLLAYRLLGGQTGDVLGALILLSETAALIALA